MQRHTKIYFDHFKIAYYPNGEHDFIACEMCGSKAVDIHHIEGRGKDKDVITNLVALCRSCHDDAHAETLTKQEIKNRIRR
jgi:hypothetical protein